MSVITWQNVNTPQTSDAARFMKLAQESFDSAGGRINDVLGTIQKRDEANWQNQKTNNTQAYLASLQEAKTPEELAAKREQLKSMLGGFQAQVDMPAVLQATDNRPGVLQARYTQEMDYAHKVQDEKDAPMRDQAAAYIAQGKPDLAKPLIEQVQRNKAALYSALDLKQRQDVERGYADNAEKRLAADAANKELMAPVDRALKTNQGNYYGALSDKATLEASADKNSWVSLAQLH